MINWGEWEIPTNYILNSLGFILGFLVFALDYRQKGSLGILPWLMLFTVLGAFVGNQMAEIFIFYRKALLLAFCKSPLRVLFDDLGWSSEGAFFGALVSVFAFSLVTRRNFLSIADSMSLGALALGILGRTGCFLEGCCFGRPADLPWAVKFPLSAYPVHPTQLYEVGLILIYGAIILFVKNWLKMPGLLFFITMSFWGAERFLLDFLKPLAPAFLSLSWEQVISLGIVIVGIVGMIWLLSIRDEP